MTGHGGWPLNAFLRPDGVPFYAGTYFPPQPRQGMPSWPQVLEGVAQAWREQRDEIIEARRRRSCRGWPAPPRSSRPAARSTARVARRRGHDAAPRLRRRARRLGRAPKFPQASAIEFLLRRGEREMALHTLRPMAAGGMYDQVGGGFARYSVDAPLDRPALREDALRQRAARPRVPARAGRSPASRCSARRATETLDWVLRELRQEEGGFASALDADSEGVEGKFYVWTPDEVRDALGEDLAPAALQHFGILPGGNFEGANIPVRATPDPERLGEIKAGLLAARERRVRPGLDDKRLTAWNALMISALAEAGAVLERADYLDAAVAAAEFVARDMRDADGRLLRTYNRGRAKLGAYLEDHAFLLEALLTLYEATFDDRWFAQARALADEILERFADPEHGGFFAVGADHELIARRKELEDAPIPSGGSAATFGLLRLAALTGEARYEDAAASAIALLHAIAPQHPAAFGHLLQAIDFHLAPVKEVALAGPEHGRARARRARGVPAARRARRRRRGRPAARGPRGRSTAAPRPTSASASPASAR